MNQQLTQEICTLLKNELKRVHISYRQLAAELEISEVSVKRLLNNAQPLSMQRLIRICELLSFPLSKLIEEAEKNLHSIPLFTQQQDLAFYEFPPLFTFWTELTEHRKVDEIAQRYQLNQSSVYLYLRKLEKVKLIELSGGNEFRMLVPTHTSFEKGSKYPLFFTQRVLSGLQERVIDIAVDDDHAFLTMLKAELTHEEFLEITQQLEDWMFNMLRESQNMRTREGLNTQPYSFGFMGAQGEYHDKLPQIPNITDTL